MSLQIARRAALGLVAGLLLAGAAQAQSMSVKVDGRAPAAVRSDIERAAVRVCREADFSPLAPIIERGCVEDTVAASLDKLTTARAHAGDLSAVEAPKTAHSER